MQRARIRIPLPLLLVHAVRPVSYVMATKVIRSSRVHTALSGNVLAVELSAPMIPQLPPAPVMYLNAMRIQNTKKEMVFCPEGIPESKIYRAPE